MDYKILTWICANKEFMFESLSSVLSFLSLLLALLPDYCLPLSFSSLDTTYFRPRVICRSWMAEERRENVCCGRG